MYIVRGDDHICHIVSCLFMAIVLLCIWDYCMYLQSCEEFGYYIILLDGWFFITPLLGWNYNVFRPSYDPSDLTHYGASVITDFITPSESHLYGLPLSLYRLLGPLRPFFVLLCIWDYYMDL